MKQMFKFFKRVNRTKDEEVMEYLRAEYPNKLDRMKLYWEIRKTIPQLPRI